MRYCLCPTSITCCCVLSALYGIRTHTNHILDMTPLPFGIREHLVFKLSMNISCGWCRIRTYYSRRNKIYSLARHSNFAYHPYFLVSVGGFEPPVLPYGNRTHLPNIFSATRLTENLVVSVGFDPTRTCKSYQYYFLKRRHFSVCELCSLFILCLPLSLETNFRCAILITRRLE